MTDHSAEPVPSTPADPMPEPCHLTLGDVIERLRKEPDLSRLVRLGWREAYSYRGYYEQLAFELAENVTVADMLACAENARGRNFYGWKGGEYTMDVNTDVWLVSEPRAIGETLGAVLLELMLGTPPLAQGGIVTPDARCPARYEREGGAQPGDRIVKCHLQKGHPGEHEEADTEVTWIGEVVTVALEDRIADALLDPAARRAFVNTHMRETERRERAAYERGKAEERARQFDHAKLAAVICATRDDAVHQLLDENFVCRDCEEIAREVQQHLGGGQDGQ